MELTTCNEVFAHHDSEEWFVVVFRTENEEGVFG